jgi:hypothetical protein
VRDQIYQADEFPLLVDAAVAEGDDERGTERAVYAQDISRPHPPGWVPETVLVLVVSRGWGGAYYRDRDDTGKIHAWITHNPQPSGDAPTLLYDDQAPANFPVDAVLPVDQLRRAVEEYLRTGQRPTCVQWRVPDRWLTW